MANWIGGKWREISLKASSIWRPQTFRLNAALEAIARAAEDNIQTVALYNHPSFSGSFSALFAHLYHSRLNLPCLVLPFSSIEPLRAEDTCYLLDFVGPNGFSTKLSQQSMCESILMEIRLPRAVFNVNLEKSSSIAVYEYFSFNLANTMFSDAGAANLLNTEDRGRIEEVLKYIEDADLRRWSLPEIKAFMIGLGEWRSKLNCITNPYMYEQLLGTSSTDLIAEGNLHISSHQTAANKFLDKAFKFDWAEDCMGSAW